MVSKKEVLGVFQNSSVAVSRHILCVFDLRLARLFSVKNGARAPDTVQLGSHTV
jgi:hypothetical protein